MVISAIVTIIAAYLIGSINFAVIFTKAFVKEDVRNFGSGNAGATNVMRVGGPLPGILTFLCDVLKGFVASYLGKVIFAAVLAQTDAAWAQPIYGAYLCGLACILGHVLPLFFHFRGGKGVATAVGIFLVCSPPAIGIGLAFFAILVLTTRIVSLSSLAATVTVILLSLFFYNPDALFWPQAVLSIAMGTTVFIKHADNIKRLINGQEKRLKIRRQK